MSSKNKVTQAERRALRSAYQTQVKEHFNLLNQAIKPRPKYVPSWLWAWGAKIFIDVEVLREYLG